MNTDRYEVSLRIESERGKIQIRITPNADTFHAVIETHLGPCLTSMMKAFANIINGFYPLNIFAKKFHHRRLTGS